jgi:hypothetical protein
MDGIRRSLGRFVVPILLTLSTSSAFGIVNLQYITALDRGTSSLATRGVKSSTTRIWSTPENPFSSIMGDFASAIMGKGGSVPANGKLDSSLANIMSSTTWTDIRSKLEAMQTEEERQFRNNVDKGYGVGSPMNKIRLYDESNNESDVRVTFYRDHASWW